MVLTIQEDLCLLNFTAIQRQLELGLKDSVIRRLEGKLKFFINYYSNYGPTLKTSRLGNLKYGTDQVLWLLHDYVTEAGTMNFFVFWKNEAGEDELVTPPLDGTILPGVTRDSILTLTRELKEFKVSTRPYKIQELMKACKEKRLYEAFGAGTAAIVSPVQSFVYQGETFEVPVDKEKGAGKLTQRML